MRRDPPGDDEGLPGLCPLEIELEMTDLEALVVAAYVFADEYPVPPRAGRKPLISDAELIALAVAQAAIGISSDRQFLELIGLRPARGCSRPTEHAPPPTSTASARSPRRGL